MYKDWYATFYCSVTLTNLVVPVTQKLTMSATRFLGFFLRTVVPLHPKLRPSKLQTPPTP